MRLKLSREQKIAHRFLSSFHMVADRMDSSIECLERAESARTSISASIGAMSFSGEQYDKMLNAMLRMDSAIDEIGELADGYSEQFKEVEGYVSAVQRIDPQAGKALRKVYIEGLSVKEAAADEECAKKTVYEYLKKGLDLTFILLSREDD